MTMVDQHAEQVGVTDACKALGVSRATWYRRRQRRPDESQPAARSRTHPRKLSDPERSRVMEVLCDEEFRDLAPREIYAILLDRGEYLCSTRTMYRILSAHRAVRERRNQRKHPVYAVPRCCATGPNQVWSWDITKIAGPYKKWFNLYVVLDIYSRQVVAWKLAKRESGFLASKLIGGAVRSAGIDANQLTIHADRGSPMKSHTLIDLLDELDVLRSYSRPRVSNDNAYSESQFKTMKYRPDYPASFIDIEAARAWCQTFFHWYNNEHRHEGIAFFTPADVHTGRHLEIDRTRQRALDGAYALHPERFVRKPPTSPTIPDEVWINRPNKQSVVIAPAAAPDNGPRALPGEESPGLGAAPEPPGNVQRRKARRGPRLRNRRSINQTAELAVIL